MGAATVGAGGGKVQRRETGGGEDRRLAHSHDQGPHAGGALGAFGRERQEGERHGLDRCHRVRCRTGAASAPPSS